MLAVPVKIATVKIANGDNSSIFIMPKTLLGFAALLVYLTGCSHKAGGVNVWTAIEQDDPEAIQRYVDAGGRLDLLDRDGRTLLFKAFEDRKKGAFEKLLKCGADPNVVMSRRRCVVHASAHRVDDPDYLELVLNHGGNPNLVNKGPRGPRSESTPLLFAINNGYFGPDAEEKALNQVETLVRHGANINMVVNGQSALYESIGQANFKIALYLLKNGADYDYIKPKSYWRGMSNLEILKDRWQQVLKDKDFFSRERVENLKKVVEWFEQNGIKFPSKE